MTVAVQTPEISYIENGSTLAFPVPWRYDSPSDLRAIRRAPDGTETVLVNGLDFTATSGATNAGGTLTTSAAAESGTRLTIWRDTARAQTADYIESGAFTAESHEQALDKAMLVNQEQDAQLARSILTPRGEAAPGLPAAVNRAGKVFAFGSDGSGLFDIDADKLRDLIGAVFNPVFTQLASLVMFVAAIVGAVTRSVQEKLRDFIGVKDFANFATAITSVSGAGGGTIYVPLANYTLATDLIVPDNVTLRFHSGAVVSVNSGVTLDIRGEVDAPSHEIFDGAGTVRLDGSPSGYNLAWFKTADGFINDRFDFAKRGMTSFNRKRLRIPPPRRGQAGTFTNGSRTFWLFDAPMVFADEQNTMDVYVEGEFRADDDCDAFMEFDDTTKPESICFYGSIQAAALATQTVGVGIDIKAGQRIQFFGNVLLNGFQTSVRIGSPDATGGVGDIYMPMLQASFFYENALLIWGRSGSLTAQGILIGQVNATSAQTTGLSAVKIGGVVRAVNIGQVFYATDVAKDGYAAQDAGAVVEITSPGGSLLTAHVNIGGIYQANSNVALLITSSAGSPARADIRDITVRRIWGRFNQTAANVDHCTNVTIEGIENTSDVVIGSNAANTVVEAYTDGMRTLTNGGLNSRINGIGIQTRGGNVPPSPSVAWALNQFIRESSDNHLYMRVANAGLASDFIKICAPPAAGIPNATGGSTVDAEARAALNALLAAVRNYGIIIP